MFRQVPIRLPNFPHMAWVNPWFMVFRHLPRVPLYSVVVNIMKFYHDRDSNPDRCGENQTCYPLHQHQRLYIDVCITVLCCCIQVAFLHRVFVLIAPSQYLGFIFNVLLIFIDNYLFLPPPPPPPEEVNKKIAVKNNKYSSLECVEPINTQ